jgi:Antitoxin Xre/MbcA/ParS C-terminal toxin-binding domain/Antitoxin Xre-like helix-turn-helix domain
MPTRAQRTAARAEPGAVLAKATLRAADLLDVTDADLATTIGTSASSISRTRTSGRPIDPACKEGELAVLFVRMYRNLDALLGDTESCRKWMHAENHHLGGVPARLIRNTQGLVHVIEYLDAMRGKL